MGPMMRSFAESLRFTHQIMNLVTHDLEAQDVVRRARGSHGPSIAWLIGHLMHYRILIMNLMGVTKPSPYEEKFGAAGASDGRDYPTLGEFKAQWDSLHAELEKAIEPVTDQQLLAVRAGGGPHAEKKVLDSLAFYVWHEAYHMGVLGALRVEFGYPATADLAVKAAQAAQAKG